MPNNDKPNHRLRKVQNARNLTRPLIEAVVELKKGNLEMHLEPTPKAGAPQVCTGNPMCYCVGVGNCSCDQVCSCDAVCARDPDCSCVGHVCTCEGHCGAHCACDRVCTAYCTCNWDGICECNFVCTWYPV